MLKEGKKFWRGLAIGLAIALVGGWFALDPISEQLDRYLNDVVGTQLKISEHAKELHSKLVIVDLHADSLLWRRDLLQRNTRGHIDVPRLIEGNVAVQAFTIVTKVPSHVAMANNHADSDDVTLLALVSKWPAGCLTKLSERVLFQARKLQEFASQSKGQLTIIRTTADLKTYLARRQKDASCTAGFLGIEGAHALDGDLANIDAFFDAGIRMMAPTHFFDNDVGSSAHGVLHEGLTDKGKDMVRRMQAKHMILDLAHASPRTIKDALAISTAPVVVSHTGVKGTCDSVRNLSDAELTGVAKTGGVIGIGYWPEAICGNSATAIAKAMRYTSKLVGVEHVALGSDFDGTASVPFDSAYLIQVTQALIDEGFADQDIKLIMGKNAIRVLETTLPPQ